ncbi:bifunctional diaminohydroxyphosphoribosylaminopyrimidine deaminase/5-amino-6-(5-phosphoribosylamino)uracil reductase RibD [Kutzneria buriramensis]|uniref:diaminohydroxyphosphoribosylaminopyrimidine deaminase n=1 Tax=Kutzneria buriramensis TaxID=1045776 RepID=A0A3E0GVI9_9PSEU|nr:bifunctional diaminohydroxyphosphoribosylaminopyrimidine deaminase/5-amino-6-(5-phosphoribosylamino)uracil reductase RibD [Kutzneria buriramensis]REH28629.1 diaminohydroxyphosphoribosylaminopyrimidine deaminase/5-amino-6-(5-phosphoribosylamino)uracil reductase [Kutzneria buriramensis]
MTPSEVELDAMRRAIAVSALGLGSASPNPPVGCVILGPDDRPVGEGYHRRKGESHAEVHALQAAGDRAAGGTAVVTLEPCNHFGRTPPCHQALIDAGVVRVLIAVIDPTSRGAGGAARMRDAGVDVEVGVLADEAEVVLGPWLRSLNTRRPKVIWAYEVAEEGIGPICRQQFVALGLRAGVDAVLDRSGSLQEGRPGQHGVTAFSLPRSVGDPAGGLRTLFEAGVRTVLLDGGPEVAALYVDHGLVDEIFMYVGETAPSNIVTLVDQLIPDGFQFRSVRRLEEGVLVGAALADRL